MKKLKLSALLLLTLCIGFSSCKKDEEDEDNSPKALILGKWSIKKDVVTSYNGTTVVNTYTFDGYTAADYFEMKNDGKYYYPIQGQAALESGTYKLNDAGTKLTLDEVDDIEVYDIKVLSKTALVLTQESTHIEGGVTIRTVEEITHSK